MARGVAGKWHGKTVAEKVVKFLQRLDEQIIDRKPQRPAPVGIAAKEPGSGLGWFIIHPVFGTIDVELAGKQFSSVTWPLIRGLFVANP